MGRFNVKIKMDRSETYFSNGEVKLHLQSMPLVFGYSTLRQFIGKKVSDIYDLYEYMSDWVLKTLNSNLLNHVSIRISNIFGEEFLITFNRNQITIWDHTGHNLLYRKSSELFTKEIFRDLKQAIENWTEGYVNCSDCNKKTQISEIGGKYFAGNYCTACWENKWKAIEEKETYN